MQIRIHLSSRNLNGDSKNNRETRNGLKNWSQFWDIVYIINNRVDRLSYEKLQDIASIFKSHFASFIPLHSQSFLLCLLQYVATGVASRIVKIGTIFSCLWNHNRYPFSSNEFISSKCEHHWVWSQALINCQKYDWHAGREVKLRCEANKMRSFLVEIGWLALLFSVCASCQFTTSN